MEKRYEGVVASALMRAMFPKDAARRAFLKSVGASTALAALSQFFPLQTATEVFAEAGTPEKKDLKVGFIPITVFVPEAAVAASMSARPNTNMPRWRCAARLRLARTSATRASSPPP